MSEALAIFGRYPRLGEVKSRLSPLLSDRERLDFYRCALRDTLESADFIPAERFLYMSGCSEAELAQWAAQEPLTGGLRLRTQKGRDLGERMAHAIAELLLEFDSVVVIGTDCPHLPSSRITQAFDALESTPVVIGPCDDGGYYLIGMTEERPGLFNDIQWGSGAVLDQTLEKLSPGAVKLLSPFFDLDTPGDLERLYNQHVRDWGPASRSLNFIRGKLGPLKIRAGSAQGS